MTDARPPLSASRLFDEALELPPEERAAFLDRACAGDAARRAEVESLLAALPAARQFFVESPVAAAAGEWLADAHGLAPGVALGPYRLIEPIASGGMGTVWLAERIDETYRQRVAIKLLHPGLGGPRMLDRFRTERQLLADLQHPGIAHLIDGGTAPGGLPYLVMEYVDGVPIDRHCRERELSVEARLRLFLDVCDAVHYAHARLVVHRDLKPGNIFVDATGHVRLLDFGIAKVLDPAELATGGSRETVTELRAFTPRYASPEQMRGERVTTATDIYSLGLVLCELLVDRLPERTAGAATGLTLTVGESPTRPSVLAGGRRARRLAGDLDTIVLRALAWEPERRYPTVGEFAADVLRHLEGRPVLARPDTAAYRLSRFVRRNKVVTVSVLTVIATLALALAVTTREYRRAVRSADEARQQAYVSSIVAAEASIVADNLIEADRRLAAAPEALRGWEWRHLRSRLDRSRRSWNAHRGGITHLAVSSSGRRIASSSMDSTVALWDAGSGRLLKRWDGIGSVVETVAMAADSLPVAAGCGDGRVLLLDPGAPPRELLPRGDRQWASVAWSPDGRRLAAGFFSGEVLVWEAATGRRVTGFRAHPIFAVVAFLPDGRRLVTGGGDGMVRLWDFSTGRRLREWAGHARRIYDLAVSPDGRRLVTGSMDRTARVWSLDDGRELADFRSHRATVSAVAIHPDGERVATAGSDHQFFVWEAATGGPPAELHGHTSDVSALAASPDGRRLVSGDWQGEIREWSWATQDVRTLRLSRYERVPEVYQALLDPTTGWLAAATNLEVQPVWPPGGTDAPRELELIRATRVAFAPDGRLLVGRDDGEVSVCRVDSDRVERNFAAHASALRGLAFSPRGDRFATCGDDSTLALWSWPSGARLITLRSGGATFRDVEFSPDGRLLVAAGSDGVVRAWSSDGAGPERRLAGHAGPVNDVEFSPDGRRLLSASDDGTVRAWDPLDGRPIAVLYRSESLAGAVACSPDGHRIAVGGSDTIVHLLEAASGREIVGLNGHVARINSLRFSADGHRLISASRDGTIRLWED